MPDKLAVPLLEIDRAIRLNCRIEQHSVKPLTLVKDHGVNNKGVARSLFIYVALRTGYTREQIMDFLGIDVAEYDKQVGNSLEYYRCGRELFYKYRDPGAYRLSKDTYLFFYRKLLLVSNYIKFRYGVEVETKKPQ